MALTMAEQPAESIAQEPKNLPKEVKKEEEWVSWSAPARLYKKRNREYYTTIASIVFLLAIILLLLKEFLLIGVIIAFGFLSYVLASVPPEKTNHQITTKGIRTEGKLFEWESLWNFWVEKKWGQEVAMVRTKSGFPGHIMMIIDSDKRETILKSLGKKLELEKPQDSFVDRASKWLQDKVPLENA